MIQHIFFDIGGVLIDIHPDKCLKYWADSTDLTLDKIRAGFSDEVHQAYEIGQLTDFEFFNAFKNSLPQPCCLKESDFWRGWQNLLGRETPASDLLASLSNSYNIWLLSNTNPRHINDGIKFQYRFINHINGAIYSFDAGSRKPEIPIYDYALKISGAMASESLLIDDLKDNIEMAKGLGWSAIQYQDISQIKNELNSYGISIQELKLIT